jgi:hypothetical protein
MHGTLYDDVIFETWNFPLINFPRSLLWTAFLMLKGSFIASFNPMKK